ncbi:aminoglycoside phosphotransferase family protein [Paenibacillus glucanolyticus]|uniref:aminoglycoside phosphotransferase family protein n=1 Tax=Paenibacillus glucanolyticus TaxID=59843 RepID=UPI003D03C6E3
MEKSDRMVLLLEDDTTLSVTPLDSGLEAEVMKISSPESDFVLKVWNKESQPNVQFQYEILNALHTHGSAVSKPVGWGYEVNGHQVLLTSYDGTPIDKVDQPKLKKLAKNLNDVHKFPLDRLTGSALPSYDFIDYFYPQVDQHPDIQDLLVKLVQRADLKPVCMIHGDYHLGNILESEGKLTVIDWTNVQIGDPRYDIAWSIILMWIYVSEKRASFYRAAFCAEGRYGEDELELFEAIACLRGILLFRANNLPIRHDTISRLKSIVTTNQYLHGKLL